jgi:DNA-directed RNA polymerase alpha subunit
MARKKKSRAGEDIDFEKLPKSTGRYLTAAGITKLSQLTALSRQQFLLLPNMGQRSLNSVNRYLKDRGLPPLRDAYKKKKS